MTHVHKASRDHRRRISQVSPSTLLNNLVSYWTMSEASGTREDTVDNNDLPDASSTGTADGLVYPTVAQFTRASSNVLLIDPVPDNIEFLRTSFTVAVWFYLDSHPSGTIPQQYNSFICTGTSRYAGGFWIRSNQAQQVVFDLNAKGDGVSQIHGKIVQTGQWYLAWMWYDADADKHGCQVSAYDVEEEDWDYGCDGTGYEFTLGKKSNAAQDYFDGRMGPIAIWSRSLTAAERAEYYNDGAGKAYPFS